MKFAGSQRDYRTVVVLGAGASCGEVGLFKGPSSFERPPLDATFLQNLALTDRRSENSEATLFLAIKHFGTFNGVGLEQLLSSVAAHKKLESIVKSVPYEEDLPNEVLLCLKEVFTKYTEPLCGEISKFPISSHLRLVANLDASDAVISFNYDTIIDHAMRLANPGRMIPSCTYHFSKQNNTKTQGVWADPEGTEIPDNLFHLLKLHGSVNFEVADRATTAEMRIRNETDSHVPLIIPPLPVKNIEDNPLYSVWQSAAGFLQDAEIVLIIGYSAPITDYVAHALLSDTNSGSSKPLERLYIANPSSTDRSRVAAMMRPRTDSHTVIIGLESFDELTAHLSVRINQ